MERPITPLSRCPISDLFRTSLPIRLPPSPSSPAPGSKPHTQRKKSRREVVGFFHAHPASPPVPSASDIRGWDGSGCHLIVGFGPSEAVRAYAANRDGTWAEIRLTAR
ncbi:Mov34/MPN/PAD-1 family protein [Cohnella rhizosphaerae]|uniref:Mov34/MPN/PAD-1 family protein n=1 Tax=Cohnella rhizosphaerae TaxID=1457232 RepID=UPI003B8A83E9